MNKSIEQIMKENNIQNQLTVEQLLLTNWKKQFNKEQLDEINKGKEECLDVSIYAKPEFNEKQMFQIRVGLENHLDVSAYAKPELSWEQMREIRYQLHRKSTN